MSKKMDMLNGDIKKVLIALSLPIIASNFVQTAFGITDMIWIGRLGTDAVSAIGTANFFISIATGLSYLITIGAGVRVAQTLGAKKHDDTKSYTKNSLLMAVFISVVFSIFAFIFAEELIAFFNMNNPGLELMAVQYLRHALFGVPFLFLTSVITSILTSYGNTQLTFKANTIGLVLNIILDPVMIFGWFGMPAMGVAGAAWATTISRMLILVKIGRASCRERV